MRWNKSLWAALLVLPLLWVLAKGFGTNPHEVPSVLVGKKAPLFALPYLEGDGVLALESLRGKPVVLNFWATWCGPCREEYAFLQKAAAMYEGRVNVVGVVYQDETPSVLKFVQEYPSVFRHVQDASSKTAIDYGVGGIPESFIVGPDGVISRKYVGVLNHEVLAEALSPWIKAGL
jgi:cytochrome c biogenesis protein CcmG/thiol:disulfide interchange protein DsbE